MKRLLMISVALGLVGCGTPQEQCISQVTRDIRVIDKLIVEVEGNLRRGYALVDVVETHPDFVDCTPDATDAVPEPEPQSCLVDVAKTVKRPVAIDLSTEAAKLSSLKTRRSQMDASTARAIAACQAQYPE